VTRFTLLGVPVDPLSEAEAVEWVVRALAEGQPRLVISVNPERIMQAGRDPDFAAILRRADLALADGAGVLWAARRLGHPLPSRLAGVDVVTALAARGAREGWRFFFLGGAPGVAEAAGRVLRDRFPGFTLAGTHAGSADQGSDPVTVELVRSSGAQLLFLAYGATAEEAYFVDTDAYLTSGTCTGLPGFSLSGGVTCTLGSATCTSGTGFTISTSHAQATKSCVWTSCPAAGAANLVCS